MSEIRYQSNQHSVQDVINRWRLGHVNLNPGFQRRSVWSDSDRRKLIESIVRGYPLPAIFMYERHDVNGHVVYDVIDGKQRLESILMFAGELRGRRFSAKLQLPGDDERQDWNWRKLEKCRRQHLITAYKLQVIEVEGDLADVIDLFVRINSTGKALTSQEKRHARYYSHSEFLKSASKLAEQLRFMFLAYGIMTESQLSRMKHIELICELMLSVLQDDVVNKKAALDHVMSANRLTARQLANAQKRAGSAIRKLFKVFPDIRSTRFAKLSDFYSLAFLIAKFEAEGISLVDRKRNLLAREILTAFGTGVDHLRAKLRKLEPGAAGTELYRDYLLTVTEGTDRRDNRLKRVQILRGLLEPIFQQKDQNRGFSSEQRRILWNTIAERRCEECRAKLTWSDFTIDHIDPWSKGGKSDLENAALYCRPCNSSKGNRDRLRKRARSKRVA